MRESASSFFNARLTGMSFKNIDTGRQETHADDLSSDNSNELDKYMKIKINNTDISRDSVTNFNKNLKKEKINLEERKKAKSIT